MHFFNDRVREFRCAGFSAHIAGQLLGVTVNAFQRIANLRRRLVLSEMANHEQGRAQ